MLSRREMETNNNNKHCKLNALTFSDKVRLISTISRFKKSSTLYYGRPTISIQIASFIKLKLKTRLEYFFFFFQVDVFYWITHSLRPNVLDKTKTILQTHCNVNNSVVP